MNAEQFNNICGKITRYETLTNEEIQLVKSIIKSQEKENNVNN
jgi:hypothetical protein